MALVTAPLKFTTTCTPSASEPAMATHPAIRFISSSGKSALSLVHLQCHVKPGASKQREGIIAVSNAVIEVCVSAQPRDGEANKAVREVISSVRKFRGGCLLHLILARS